MSFLTDAAATKNADASVKPRIRTERRIAVQLVEELLSHGFYINTDNGGDDFELKAASNDRKTILENLFLSDEDRLFIYTKDAKKSDRHAHFAWIYLVYGNDGWDVISDYTTNLEEDGYITKTLALVEKLG